MPYTIEDFRREIAREHIQELTPEERLAGLLAGEIVKRLSAKERLAGLSAVEVLKRFSTEQIEAYLKRLGRKPPCSRRKKPKRTS